MPDRTCTAVWINRVLVVAMITVTGCGASSSDRPRASDPEGDIERGEQLTVDLGCAACHSADGSSRIGPSWAGSWGSAVELDDGSQVVFDDEYVIRSVRDPAAERRPGSWIQMPPFGPARLSDEDLAAIATYVRSLAEEQ